MTNPPIPDELLPLFLGSDGTFIPHLWWVSFDTFLVPLVALAAKKLREDGIAYPGDMTPEEWHDYLKSIEDDLTGYNKFDRSTPAEDLADYRRVQDAMRRFVDRMSNWWD